MPHIGSFTMGQPAAGYTTTLEGPCGSAKQTKR
jgi:hypothetical protein